MNMIHTPSAHDATRVRVTDQADDLAEILSPDCAAVIWQRQQSAGLTGWLNALDPESLPKARLILKADEVSAAVTSICETSDLTDHPECALLVDDIASLSDIFVGIMNCRLLRLRLDVVTNNACRKFHVDAVASRLICTYRGTGTQYGTSVDGADPLHIFEAPTGAPMLLRGTDFQHGTQTGLLHRSPPIEGTGETRLVLVLDPLDDYEQTV